MTLSRTNPALLERAAHGGNRAAWEAALGLENGTLIDFSASLNPFGPPACVGPLVREFSQRLNAYPEPDCKALKQHLAAALDVDITSLLPVNGSTELIYLLPRLLPPGREALLIAPCFSEYARAFNATGVGVNVHQLDPNDGFQLNANALLARMQRMPDPGALVLGHPASPNGRRCERDTLLALLDQCERRSILLIVDEAFIDFASPGASLIDRIPASRSLILVRSMTKFYAIAGLRLGYGIAHPDTISRLNAVLPPWSVNALAQAVGSAVLGDTDFPDRTRRRIRTEREYLYGSLSAMPDIQVFASDANFLLFRLEGNRRDGRGFFQSLLRQGLLVRHCGNFDGLDERYFRVAVRTRADNERLIAAVRSLICGNPDSSPHSHAEQTAQHPCVAMGTMGAED